VNDRPEAVSSLVRSNSDRPEATTQALNSLVTGQGLGPYVPTRGACPSFPAGRWGYPCFRAGALPIIILFTDAPMRNGPLPGSVTYGDPPFNGILGAGALLPPVEQDPGMLYATDAFTAHDLGDLTMKSVTVMGTNGRFDDSATTWNAGLLPTRQQEQELFGWIRRLRQVLTQRPNDLVGQRRGHALSIRQCGARDFVWQLHWLRQRTRRRQLVGPPQWHEPSGRRFLRDQRCSGASQEQRERQSRPFQIRIQTTPSDPSWLTADLPIPWANVEAELLAAGVKILTVISPTSTDAAVVTAEAEELANITGSVDQAGDPYVERIATDGTGLSTAILDAVDALVGNTRRDITSIAEDNPATSGVDERDFVKLIEASSCPTVGVSNCLGGTGTDTCLGCLADADVRFQFRISNDFVTPTLLPQVFEFEMVAIADGSVELLRIPVRLMVPGTGFSYGNGFYENTYEADYVCEMPPERPDWGDLTWIGSTPSDSTVEFEIFTGNSLAEMDAQIPMSIVYPTDTTLQTYDIGEALIANGFANYMPFLRVKAKLNASSDSFYTPIFTGWSMQFNCVPLD